MSNAQALQYNIGDRVRVYKDWDYSQQIPRMITMDGYITGYVFWPVGGPAYNPTYYVTTDDGKTHERNQIEKVLDV